MIDVYELPYTSDFYSSRPLLILDRDSTIIRDRGYTWRVDDLDFIPGALDSLKFAKQNNFTVALATNQSGLGRGFFSLADYVQFSNQLVHEVAKNGGRIDFIATCPHLPIDNCVCRKPKPGLVNFLLRKFNVEESRAILVGDSESDIQAGRTAGISSHLATGSEIKNQVNEWLKQNDYH